MPPTYESLIDAIQDVLTKHPDLQATEQSRMILHKLTPGQIEVAALRWIEDQLLDGYLKGR
jgi:hypothetical protein